MDDMDVHLREGLRRPDSGAAQRSSCMCAPSQTSSPCAAFPIAATILTPSWLAP